jgi:hypothetical protein
MMHPAIAMYATAVRNHLLLLAEERVLAHENGLGADPAYMTDLENEIATTRDVYVGAAVTEIALLRAEFDGANHG